MGWAEAVGYLASGLVFVTFCMRTMVPLRIVAISSNIAFIVYGTVDGLYPILVLHLVLLPMNIWRMIEMLRLVKRVKAASTGDLSVEWLKPFMKGVHYNAGYVLFCKGDQADRIFMLLSGEIVFEEINVTIGPGDVFGEVALFSAARQRTQTARAKTNVHLLWIEERDLAQLCYQRPAVSFHLLRLITNRLLTNAASAIQPATPASFTTG